MTTLAFYLDDKTRKQIDTLVRITGKPEKVVIQEVVKNGLQSYHTTPSQSAKAVLDLIEWAEQEHITSQAHDLSTNHNTYAWDE